MTQALDTAKQEREFLHKLCSGLGTAMLYADLINENQDLKHLSSLVQCLEEMKTSIDARSKALGTLS